MIRPEALAFLDRWRDLGFAAGIGLLGLWCLRLGGWVFVPMGLLLIGLAGALAVIALRRLRFGGGGQGAGLVELDEAQIAVFGPEGGGFVSLREMTELRLLRRGAQRYWRVKQEDGQALLIPVDATGAERLFDAFSTLPGMDSEALVAALRVGPESVDEALGPVVWRRNQATGRLGAA